MKLLSRLLSSATPHTAPKVNLNPLNQPTIPTRGGWILCQDAQPEFAKPVLVMLQNVGGDFPIGIGVRTECAITTRTGIQQEGWTVRSLSNYSGNVVAWQPLPEPLR